MTLEGCVVRMADTISYIGRDLEDAIRFRIIRRCDIPREVARRFGTPTERSYSAWYRTLSEAATRCHTCFQHRGVGGPHGAEIIQPGTHLFEPEDQDPPDHDKKLFELLFERFLTDLGNKNTTSVIYTHFLKGHVPNVFGTPSELRSSGILSPV